MVSTGTLSFVNGSPTLSGQYSGFDTNAIIEASLLAKRLPAVRLESTIEKNDLKAKAYSELSSLLAKLQTASSSLRGPTGSLGANSNIFETKAAFLTSGNTNVATSLVGVSAQNTAAAGVYDLEILRIAKANKISSGTVTDAAAAQGVTDTITIGVAGGATKDVTITPGSSLNDIAAAINAVKGDTKVRAAVIKVADNDFRLVLTAEETGKAITLSGVSGEFLTAYGNGASLSELEPAQTAQIKLDGIATVIERTSNEVTDVLDGVTFQLYKADVGNQIKVEIQNNLGSVKEKIAEFVQAYNDLRDLVTTQRDYDPASSTSSKPILFGDDILRGVEQKLFGNISAGAFGLSNTVLSTFGAVGISVDGSNKLKIDDAKLDDALLTKLDEVRNVFEFGFTSDSQELRILARTRAVNVDNFELNITVDGSGTITGASVTGEGNVFDVSGNTLTGKVGTAYEGFKLVYTGTASTSIQVQTSLGIAESIYQTLEEYVAPSGLIASKLSDLTASNTSLNEKIVAIDSRLSVYRLFLLDKYSRLEQSLAQADAMKRQLEAAANAQKS
ncbi:flagellar filament capping protein FliD [Kiloniella laminariae]|uniref:Flagellar hook-associated protein 2 n=1 Tax=Kiloniella laminariae TaxID=454162 RepID=A0ABT4LKJ6_9PROT|nr:flagellar filament capping protein FliD [Kiloniella laminariae]MCZ4280512.1 flagellar filament capping protein FliD [Kiloniella laminariae]